MNTSSRFIVATHILVSMAVRKILSFENKVLNSEMLALSVNTNPVVIRRTIGLLKEAGLVESQSGPKGGAILAKAPADITLANVHKAVDNAGLFHMHYCEPNQMCGVGKNIQASLFDILEEAKRAMSQTELQKRQVLKFITNYFLKLIEIS